MIAVIGNPGTTSPTTVPEHWHVIEVNRTHVPDKLPMPKPEPRWKTEQRNSWKRRRK